MKQRGKPLNQFEINFPVMNTANVGTVSKGTLKREDLIPAFHAELKELDEGNDFWKELVQEVSQFVKLAEETPALWYSDTASHLLDDLYTALGDYTPPYCYFGAIEGDGSDIGFWPDPETIEYELDRPGSDIHTDKTIGALVGDFVVSKVGDEITLKRICSIDVEEVWQVG